MRKFAKGNDSPKSRTTLFTVDYPMPITNYQGPQRAPLMREIEVVLTERELRHFKDNRLDTVARLLNLAGIPAAVGDRRAINPLKVSRGELRWIHYEQEGRYVFIWTEPLDDGVEDAVIITDIPKLISEAQP